MNPNVDTYNIREEHRVFVDVYLERLGGWVSDTGYDGAGLLHLGSTSAATAIDNVEALIDTLNTLRCELVAML